MAAKRKPPIEKLQEALEPSVRKSTRVLEKKGIRLSNIKLKNLTEKDVVEVAEEVNKNYIAEVDTKPKNINNGVEDLKDFNKKDFQTTYRTLLRTKGVDEANSYRDDVLEHLLYIKANTIQIAKALGVNISEAHKLIKEFRKFTYKKINNLEWYDVFSDNYSFAEKSSGLLLNVANKLINQKDDLQSIRTANQLYRTVLMLKRHALITMDNLGWIEHHKYTKPLEEKSSENRLNVINKMVEASVNPYTDTQAYLEQIENLIPGITTNKQLAREFGYLQAYNLKNGLDLNAGIDELVEEIHD
jgi:hypothetical protein